MSTFEMRHFIFASFVNSTFSVFSYISRVISKKYVLLSPNQHTIIIWLDFMILHDFGLS